jgi:hypothetical protein
MAAESEIEDFIQKAGPAVYRGAMRGGEFQAFLRQGANEIGAALKAFPDSLQVDEPGAVLNPLYSDISADKRSALYGADKPAHSDASASTPLPSPSQIAEGNYEGSVYGESIERESTLPSPSEIADNTPMPTQAEREHDHGQERGSRGM